MRCISSLLLLFVVCGDTHAAAKEKLPAPALGQQIAEFSVQDYRGKWHALSDYADRELVVVAFMGTECPLARLYAPRLQELADEFEDRGVAVLVMNSNRQDSISEIANYARVHNLRIPVLKDAGNVVADQFGARRTPEVFVLDGERTVRYAGRIDDQYGLGASSGYAKTQIRRRHLAEALEQLLAGDEVEEPLTEPHGCIIGRVREADESSDVTYSDQVARVLQTHCVECHRDGQIAPFTLTDYDEVVGWAEMIAEVVRDRRMPPWHASSEYGHFRNDRSMSEAEREIIYEWVANGAPQGDPADLPEPIEYPEGWQISGPDQVVYMSDEPYSVPAEGAIEYQYFYVDPGWTEDRWIKATECQPGNRSVVHHIFVFAVPPDVELEPFEGPSERSTLDFNPGQGGVELIAGNAPGTPPMIAPDGMATYVKAGTKLVFQMHYTPNGHAVEDRSAVGFAFCDASEVRHNVAMSMAINFGFTIPPGADNHPVEAVKTFKTDTLILTMAPHMHLRGKAFRYELHYPDGTKEVLLDVPHYDFNWQVVYALAEPKLAPAGSRLYCLAHFDNSENNLANPDPTDEVRWGDQTWEEMMIGWFAESTDVGPGQFGSQGSRTERFVEETQGKKLRVGGLLKRAAEGAADSELGFERLWRYVERDIPQIDRVCLSVVDGKQVRMVQVAQSPVLNHPAGRTERTFAADTAALARIASGSEAVEHADLSTAEDADLQAMASALRSSFHVPVDVAGKPGVLSFWSKEPAAFPESAQALLREVGQIMGGNAGQQQARVERD